MLPIDSIAIGERMRKDMGDLAGLAESIKNRGGLLHPVVVNKEHVLIAGYRRIEAARLLGWTEIPVTIIEVDDLLSAERDENSERKDFTPSEAVAIGRLIEERHRVKVVAAKTEHNRRIATRTVNQPSGSVPYAVGPVRETAAKAVGMSSQKYDMAKSVVTAAEACPEKFGDIPIQMDETGNVYGAHRELERRRAGNFDGDKKRNGFRNDKSIPFEIKTKRHRVVAEAQKERMVRSLSIVTGHCRGLEGLDVQAVLAVCSQEELAEWSGKAREAGRAFFKLSGKLKNGKEHGN